MKKLTARLMMAFCRYQMNRHDTRWNQIDHALSHEMRCMPLTMTAERQALCDVAAKMQHAHMNGFWRWRQRLFAAKTWGQM